MDEPRADRCFTGSWEFPTGFGNDSARKLEVMVQFGFIPSSPESKQVSFPTSGRFGPTAVLDTADFVHPQVPGRYPQLISHSVGFVL